MTATQSKEKITVYSENDVQFDKGAFIEVCYEGMILRLMFKNVGDDKEPVMIAIFDPTTGEAKELGKQALIDMLAEYVPADTLVITPESSKSKEMITEACAAKEIECLVLKGGREEAAVMRQVHDEGGGEVIPSYPITSENGKRPKFMGFTAAHIQKIDQAVSEGKTILLLDDVVSSGGTMEAIINFIRIKHGKAVVEAMIKNKKLQIKAVAREVVVNDKGGYQRTHLDEIGQFAFVIPKILRNQPQAQAA